MKTDKSKKATQVIFCDFFAISTMKIVIQRVKRASVSIDSELYNQIQQGLLLLVGVAPDDVREDVAYAARKIANMRIFSDDEDKMNLSIKDVKGEILSISQFTLYADTKKAIAQLLQALRNQTWLVSYMMTSTNC